MDGGARAPDTCEQKDFGPADAEHAPLVQSRAVDTEGSNNAAPAPCGWAANGKRPGRPIQRPYFPTRPSLILAGETSVPESRECRERPYRPRVPGRARAAATSARKAERSLGASGATARKICSSWQSDKWMGLSIDGTHEMVGRLLLVDMLDQKRPRGCGPLWRARSNARFGLWGMVLSYRCRGSRSARLPCRARGRSAGRRPLDQLPMAAAGRVRCRRSLARACGAVGIKICLRPIQK